MIIFNEPMNKFLKNKESSQSICASGTEEKYWWMISAKNGRGSIHDSLLEGHWNADDTTIPENMSSRKSILFTFLIFIYLILLVL